MNTPISKAAREAAEQLTPNPWPSVDQTALIIQKAIDLAQAEARQKEGDVAGVAPRAETASTSLVDALRQTNEFSTAKYLRYRRMYETAREALVLAHDAMSNWFSSEWTDHPTTKKVRAVLYGPFEDESNEMAPPLAGTPSQSPASAAPPQQND